MHRPGSPLCEKNVLSALRLADRDGADSSDLLRCARWLEEENAGNDRVIEKIRAMLKDWSIEQTLKES